MTASQAGVISACVPLMVAVASWFFLRERLTGTMRVGPSASAAGVELLTMGADPGGSGENPLLGNAMEVAAMACAAANMVLVKQLTSRCNPWTLTAMQVAAGSVFFLPGLRIFFESGGITLPWPLVLSILFLGGCVSPGAFGMYNWAMSRLSAAKASAFINLVPVVAVILGWGLLGESLNRFQLMAAAAVIGGVWLSQSVSSEAPQDGRTTNREGGVP
jgi:drug/metabolite transporter (DMT)-like permease